MFAAFGSDAAVVCLLQADSKLHRAKTRPVYGMDTGSVDQRSLLRATDCHGLDDVPFTKNDAHGPDDGSLTSKDDAVFAAYFHVFLFEYVERLEPLFSLQ